MPFYLGNTFVLQRRGGSDGPMFLSTITFEYKLKIIIRKYGPKKITTGIEKLDLQEIQSVFYVLNKTHI